MKISLYKSKNYIVQDWPDPTNEVAVECPYCGERISLLIDGSVPQQLYLEDCQVCCQPMAVRAEVADDGRCRVEARREDDG